MEMMTEVPPRMRPVEEELPVVAGDPTAVLGFAFGFLGIVAILIAKVCFF